MEPTVSIPENILVNFLKTLPQNVLADIFWKIFVSYDESPLTENEKKAIAKAKTEYGKGETIKWGVTK